MIFSTGLSPVFVLHHTDTTFLIGITINIATFTTIVILK